MMSIQRRLFVAVVVVLAISAIIGSVLTYFHALSKVRTEMEAAISVGTNVVQNAVDDAEELNNPRRRLRLVVADFDGDRHLLASLVSESGTLLARSTLLEPDDPAPQWFLRLVGGEPITVYPDLPQSVAGNNRIVLQSSPVNEVAEVWSDAKLNVATLIVFCVVLIVLAYWTLLHALRPIESVCTALARVGRGDYSARLKEPVPSELESLRKGFNAMTERLSEMELTNRSLTKQVVNLQEEERAQIARDLHDEVGPFLFATGADATMIRQFLTNAAYGDARVRAEAIIESVRHMQRHLRTILSRLRPGMLIDVGLEQAVHGLIEFWRARRPGIRFVESISVPTLGRGADDVVFRLIQESLSNAVRHAQPSAIYVTISATEDTAYVEVKDDGVGFSQSDQTMGFGINGMRERVAALGGTFEAQNRKDGRGIIVSAKIPLSANADDDRLELRMAETADEAVTRR
ncbi:MAG TPA: ATP-binding protein [Xanthobacteraceae bacterium]|nr:ATP-binding protein [Xanthobacteraceae bacterium]